MSWLWTRGVSSAVDGMEIKNSNCKLVLHGMPKEGNDTVQKGGCPAIVFWKEWAVMMAASGGEHLLHNSLIGPSALRTARLLYSVRRGIKLFRIRALRNYCDTFANAYLFCKNAK
jgi:hypothetical protein